MHQLSKPTRWRWAVVALVVLTAGCKSSGNQPRAPSVKLAAREPRLALSLRITAAARGPGGMLAVGTVDGGVLLLTIGRDGVSSNKRWLSRGDQRGSGSGSSGGGGEAHHDGAVTGLAFGPADKTLVSVGGRTVIWWQIDSRRALRHLVGPQRLTGVVVEPSGKAALFATRQGHVLRWKSGTTSADAVTSFACSGRLVLPSRRRLPPERRCPYGSYQERQGRGYCAYPATHLVRDGAKVARACRTGRVSVLDLRNRRVQHLGGGALGALAFVGAKTLLLARLDGQLWLYDLARREVVRRLDGPKHPRAAVSDGSLIAVASKGKLALYHRSKKAALTRAKLPGRAVWLELTERQVLALLDDGRLYAYPIER